MGIGTLWQKIGQGEVRCITEFAGEHFQRTGRPLRIAVDEAGLRYHNVNKQLTKFIRQGEQAANPNEKNILWQVLRLLTKGIQLVFVFDGPGRPRKRGKTFHFDHKTLHKLLKETLDAIGVPWHQAPGEAEAECAELEKQGIVDAVWSEDGDTLMFGSKLLIRSHYKEKTGKETGKRGGDKSTTHFQVYRAEDIVKHHPGLDREGLVLHAVLSGGDYDATGLKNFGPEGSLKAAEYGLGKELCNVSEADLPQWRQKLIAYLKEVKSPVKVPDHFPVYKHVKYYRAPLVSKSFPNFDFNPHLDEPKMQDFLQIHFNFDKSYMKWIVPMLLVKSLMQTKKGEEAINRCYQIKVRPKRDKIESKVTFLVPGISISRLIQDQSETVECELATYILQHGVPYAIPEQPAQKGPSPVKKVKADEKPTASPNRGVLQPASGKKRGRPAKEPVSAGSPNPPKRAKSTAIYSESFVSHIAKPAVIQKRTSVSVLRDIDETLRDTFKLPSTSGRASLPGRIAREDFFSDDEEFLGLSKFSPKKQPLQPVGSNIEPATANKTCKSYTVIDLTDD